LFRGMPDMKCLTAYTMLLLVPGLLGAKAATLQDARQRYLHGNYEEARELYEPLAKEPAQKVPGTIGLSRTLQSQGQYDRALEVVEAALKGLETSADLLARRAELLYLRGRWSEAEQSAATALRSKPDNFLARWVRGQIYRDQADFKKADDELRWFVRAYTDRSSKDDDIKDPEELLWVGLAGAENARWHNLSDQYRVILTDVFGDALKNEKGFWPAEYQAGMLLLEKYNRAEALDAFNKALTINPNAAEALVGKGVLALQHYEVKDAELYADQALKINPNSPEALSLRADVSLMTGDIPAAVRSLDRARKISPRNETILGRRGACLYLLRDKPGLDKLTQEVTTFDPKPGIYYYELAKGLEGRQYFEAAEGFYKKAAELRPMVPWPNNSLGLLYMRLGREDEAREVLNKAFKADEFNVLVSNTLKVLRHLSAYQTLKTEHFEIRFDPKTDRRLARYMTSYLEKIYADLTEKFHYHPSRPILFELFDNHEMFSGRVVALPDLHTVGACTGRVFAMVSPQGKGIRRPFNWGRVLRHELVHIFNLDQTSFQVPHWFTEGLAVINEGYPRPQIWNQLLRERVPARELLDLDNIELGFIRPRSALEWNLAYCQGQLYVEYMRSTYGPKTIGEMLSAYHDGLDTSAAIAKVCLVDKKAFEQGYRTYLDVVVKEIQGRPAEKAMSLSQLQKALEAHPEDLDLSARLAEQYLLRNDKKEARKLAETVLAKKGNHPLASYVKARLLLAAGDDDQARAILEASLDREAPDPKVLHALGKLYYEARDFAKAAQVYELAHRVEPYESKWLVEMARAYTQAGDQNKRLEVLKKLVETDADDLDQRKRLAQLLWDANRYAEAERYARQALEIDVRDAEAQEILQKSLVKQNKLEEAKKLEELLRK